MSQPTIEQRRRRRFILMTTDSAFASRIDAMAPEGWRMVVSECLDDVGDWNDLLLFRFLLLDLDEFDAFDPLDVIRQIRMVFQINIAVLCFGGDDEIRDEMRMSRADRCFEREELVAMLPRYFDQYGW